MFQKFYPSEVIRSTYDIDFERYYKEGYRGVIFDVDNTLVPHNAPADERAKKLFKRLDAMGMQYCFTSNNKEPRVKAFCEAVGGKYYVYKANKPSIKGIVEVHLCHINLLIKILIMNLLSQKIKI